MRHGHDIKKMLMSSIVALVGASLLGCTELSGDGVLSGGGSADLVGSGFVVEESRPVSGFVAVETTTVGTVFVRQGASESLTIRADDNIMPILHAEVRSGTLVIASEPGRRLQPSAPIEYHLTVRSLERIVLGSVGSVQAFDLDPQRMTLELTGVGRLEVSGLNTDRLEVRNSGIGNVRVAGTADRQDVVLASAGNYDGRALQSREANVTIRDRGSATVRVSGRLDATIDGAGDVLYIGNPTVTRSGDGDGRVEPIG